MEQTKETQTLDNHLTGKRKELEDEGDNSDLMITNEAKKQETSLDGKQGVWQDAYYKFCKEDGEKVHQELTINTDRSWKEVPWDVARETVAKQLLEKETKMVAPEKKEQLEKEAGAYWEKFYRSNLNKFFKDRHYLHFQFPDLRMDEEGKSKLIGKKVMEVGCGTGCTVFPLMESHPDTFFYAFDFSKQAVELVQKSEQYDEKKIKAFVCDVNTEPLPEYIEPNSLDMIIMVFVLSAIKPEDMTPVLKKLHGYLKPGGIFLVRDYGVYDMTQMRFWNKEDRKLGENYYVRADGTRVYYFTLETLAEFFNKAGYKTHSSNYDTRELRNRKKMINMYRVWVNGKFIKEH